MNTKIDGSDKAQPRLWLLAMLITLSLTPSLRAQALEEVQRMAPPAQFVRNEGQWDARARYGLLTARGTAMFDAAGMTVFTRSQAADAMPPLELPAGKRDGQVEPGGPYYDVRRIQFERPSARMRLLAVDTAKAVTHFYRGNDATRWRERVSNHARLRYENVWNGVDAVLENNAGGLTLRFEARDAEALNSVRLRVRDERSPTGRLWTPAKGKGEGDHTEFPARRPLRVDSTRIALEIDFGTFIGGTLIDLPLGFGLDSLGGIHLTGVTNSADFPRHNAAFASLRGETDRFLCGIACDGTRYVYSSYFGGSGVEDYGLFDGVWNEWWDRYEMYPNYLSARGAFVHVLVATNSADYPVTAGALQPRRATDTTSAVTAFRRDGTLHASSFLGGPGIFGTEGICTDVNGDVIVTGVALHDRLWFVTPGSLQDTIQHVRPSNIVAGAFVKLSSSLDALRFGSYFFAHGGQNTLISCPATGMSNYYRQLTHSQATLVPLTDSRANIILGGSPAPVMGTLHLTQPERDTIAWSRPFVSKITGDGSSYVYATVLGGLTIENPALEEFIVDRSDNVHIATTISHSSPFPSMWPRLKEFAISTIPAGGYWGYAALSPSGEILQSSLGYPIFSRPGHIDFALDICDNPVFIAYGTQQHTFDLDLYRSLWTEPWKGCLTPHMYYGRHLQPQPNMVSWLQHPNLLSRSLYSDRRNYFYSYAHFDAKSMRDSLCYLIERPKAFQRECNGGVDIVLTRYRITGICEPLLCSLELPDSLEVLLRRGTATPERFPVTVTVRNSSAHDPYRLRYLVLELPPRLELDGGGQSTLVQLNPDILTPGMELRHTWNVRVAPGAGFGDATVRVRLHYADPPAATDCPSMNSECERRLRIVSVPDPVPAMECAINAPTALALDGDEYTPNPFALVYRLTNRDTATVDISRLKLTVGGGMGVLVQEDVSQPGRKLAPGESLTFTWHARCGVRPLPRTVWLRVEAQDEWSVLVSRCEHELRLPGVESPRCSFSGHAAAVYLRALDSLSPHPLRITQHLRNLSDSALEGVHARIDLAEAPHLRLRTGQAAVQGPLLIPAREQRQTTWLLELDHAPTMDTVASVRVWYRVPPESAERYCDQRIPIRIQEIGADCALIAPDSLSVGEIEAGVEVQSMYTLRNTGTIPLEVARVELALPPDAGLVPLDALTQPGGTLAPGGDITRQWRLRPLALRAERSPRLVVTAYNAEDSVLAVCEHTLRLPGVEGLRCALELPDSVRFDRAALAYVPDPVPLGVVLRNPLDEEETAVEAEVDLAAAPRLELAAGEPALRVLAQVDSNATARIDWLLHALPGDADEPQRVRVRYRSAGQPVWKYCEEDVLVTAWPREIAVLCATGGHDTLHADAAYERLVPEPFEVSYALRNTGTIALRDVRA
ncbi:MAG TPA: hypothetical protein PK916_17855, partial [Bacteroidota bacterium]|nr:hypothetical protein [Bacteroidota bacterium]